MSDTSRHFTKRNHFFSVHISGSLPFHRFLILDLISDILTYGHILIRTTKFVEKWHYRGGDPVVATRLALFLISPFQTCRLQLSSKGFEKTLPSDTQIQNCVGLSISSDRSYSDIRQKVSFTWVITPFASVTATIELRSNALLWSSTIFLRNPRLSYDFQPAFQSD